MTEYTEKSRLKLIWDMYFHEMFNLCYVLTLNEAVSEGIIVEAFYRLYHKMRDVQGEINIKAFLYRTCREGALSYLKNLSHGSYTK